LNLLVLLQNLKFLDVSFLEHVDPKHQSKHVLKFNFNHKVPIPFALFHLLNYEDLATSLYKINVHEYLKNV